MQPSTDQLREHIAMLEQRIADARRALECELCREAPAYAPDDVIPMALAARVNTAMAYVRQFREFTMPIVVANQSEIEAYERHPQPKEISAMAAACDLLERFFDGTKGES